MEVRSTINRARKTFLVAAGSNLGSDEGDATATLRAGFLALADHGLTLRRLSRFFVTPCFPPGAGPDYVNACAVVDGPADPREMLQCLHAIEAGLGRQRVQRWGARSLDLDLLAEGDTVYPDAPTQEAWRHLPEERRLREAPGDLILPHPRIQDRAFVLVPLCDVAPQWRHPLLGRTVAAMTAALSAEDRAGVVPA